MFGSNETRVNMHLGSYPDGDYSKNPTFEPCLSSWTGYENILYSRTDDLRNYMSFPPILDKKQEEPYPPGKGKEEEVLFSDDESDRDSDVVSCTPAPGTDTDTYTAITAYSVRTWNCLGAPFNGPPRCKISFHYNYYATDSDMWTRISPTEQFSPIPRGSETTMCRICQECPATVEIFSESGQYQNEQVPFCSTCQSRHETYVQETIHNLETLPHGLYPVDKERHGWKHLVEHTLQLVIPTARYIDERAREIYSVCFTYTPMGFNLSDGTTFEVLSACKKLQLLWSYTPHEQMVQLMLGLKHGSLYYARLRKHHILQHIYNYL